jgi:hypothetical protein
MSCAEGCRARSRLIEYLIGRTAALAVFPFCADHVALHESVHGTWLAIAMQRDVRSWGYMLIPKEIGVPNAGTGK